LQIQSATVSSAPRQVEEGARRAVAESHQLSYSL